MGSFYVLVWPDAEEADCFATLDRLQDCLWEDVVTEGDAPPIVLQFNSDGSLVGVVHVESRPHPYRYWTVSTP